MKSKRVTTCALLAALAAALMAGAMRAMAEKADAPKADEPKADAPVKADAPKADEPKADEPKPDAEGFYSLFDGKSLDGWKVGKNADTFKVADGKIVVNGQGPAHLFYVGPVHNHDFKNFHFKAEVMTHPKANSGIYFHTKYQDDNWPSQGFECQVNATHGDWKKTGSLYNVKDLRDPGQKDDEWFTYDILVEGKKITIKIDGKTVNEFTVADDYKPPQGMPGRVLGNGTFALQGHDPGSKVEYKNIKVKPLD